MNETKRKILDASRELFNLYGLDKVSQRRIAEHLGISPGNLTYHFKKSEDIVEALYFEMVATMDGAMEEVKNMQYNLPFIFKMIDLLVECFFQYRFMLLDFVPIMRHHAKIRKHYEQLSLLRKQQFMGAIKHLRETQMIREEELPLEYEFLYDRFQILADFWISSIEIKEEGVKSLHLQRGKRLLTQSLYPYLTLEGKKAFLAVYK
jgi:AcrR family transcriptional regulator